MKSRHVYLNPSFIKSLKLQIGEEADYDQVIAMYKAEGFEGDPTKDKIITPVNFKSTKQC